MLFIKFLINILLTELFLEISSLESVSFSIVLFDFDLQRTIKYNNPPIIRQID